MLKKNNLNRAEKNNSKNYFALKLFVPSIISDVMVVVYFSNYSIVNTNVLTIAKLVCGYYLFTNLGLTFIFVVVLLEYISTISVECFFDVCQS